MTSFSPPGCATVLTRIARAIFDDNTDDKKICLEMHGLHDEKELFLFCIDLLFMGMMKVLSASKECSLETTANIEIDKIPDADFDKVRSKMLLAGIKVHFNVIFNHEQRNPGVLIRVPLTDQLKDHKFELTSGEYIYIISFEIVHI